MHLYKASFYGADMTVIIGSDTQCLSKNGRVFQSFDKRVEKVLEMRAFIKTPIEIVVNIDTDGSCAETLNLVRPHIFAKGAEYTDKDLPLKEKMVCRRMGCRIVYGVGERINSSSDLHGLLSVT